MRDHPFHDYRDRSVLVMGLGAFGGGLGAVRFLVERGARVTVTDQRSAETLRDALGELQNLPDLTYRLGEHRIEDFQSADLVVVNPAVKRNHPCLEAAREAGIPLTSEMNLFWQWNRAPVVAVTGSNGKSTTTALTHAMLSQTGRRSWLGGNIGVSLLPQVDQIQPTDVVVLELSSFQLEDLDRIQAHPAVAVVTNFAPNHLDWHGTLDEYRRAKQTLLRWQTPGDFAVLNGDDADVREWPGQGRRLLFGWDDRRGDGVFADPQGRTFLYRDGFRTELPIPGSLRLPGRHNLANAMAAACAAGVLGADAAAIAAGLAGYKPLPHRLQFVGRVGGRDFYNDSLATTPESAIVGLAAFSQPVILLAGGYDKQVDLGPFAAEIARRAKAVALMGQTASVLRRGIHQSNPAACRVSPDLANFREAFAWAVAASAPGDVILLSPGCASYDWFRNFADRGNQFQTLVAGLESEKSLEKRDNAAG